MSTAEQPEFVSTENYLVKEESAITKSEYIDGWIRAMTGGTIRHNQVKGNSFFALKRDLQGQKCQPFDSDTKLRILRAGKKRFYYPDVQVVCDSNESTSVFQDFPVLIIEVLSPSTRQIDLDEKMAAYLDIETLQCYILVEQHKPLAIVMRRTDGGFLRQTIEGIEQGIELPFLGIRLAMRDIYDGIEFTATCVQEPDSQYEAS